MERLWKIFLQRTNSLQEALNVSDLKTGEIYEKIAGEIGGPISSAIP